MAKNDIEKKIQVRRTRNRLANNLETLENSKREYAEKAKAAYRRGDTHAYTLARSGLAATMSQLSRTREMLLNIDITSQMRDTGAATEEFLTGMETIFKRLGKLNKSVDIKKARSGLRTAISGMENVQAQLDGMLFESEDMFAELSGFADDVSEKEIDRILGLHGALEEEEAIGAAIDSMLNEPAETESPALRAEATQSAGGTPVSFAEKPQATQSAGAQSARVHALPPLSLLNDNPVREEIQAENESELVSDAEKAEGVLSELGVPAKVVNRVAGPSFSRLELTMPTGVSVQKIDPLEDDIAMRLGKPTRFEVPIPGKNAFGIEVPNKRRECVGLKELLRDAQTPSDGILYCAGLNIEREPVWKDIAKAPHILVAGSTGSGKSCFLHALIASLLFAYTPDRLRLALVDLKRVEFGVYNGLPHLYTEKAVDTDEGTLALLQALCEEMERRYELLSQNVCRNLAEYNRTTSARLPYIVTVIDEYADLSLSPRHKEFDALIRSLSQKARACGIHLILATQRPSVDVISGTIKSNFPTRAAFALASKDDSRTVLGTNGAEQLLGGGDMLYSDAGADRLLRLQAPYITDDEIRRLVRFLKGA